MPPRSRAEEILSFTPVVLALLALWPGGAALTALCVGALLVWMGATCLRRPREEPRESRGLAILLVGCGLGLIAITAAAVALARTGPLESLAETAYIVVLASGLGAMVCLLVLGVAHERPPKRLRRHLGLID